MFGSTAPQGITDSAMRVSQLVRVLVAFSLSLIGTLNSMVSWGDNGPEHPCREALFNHMLWDS